MKGVFPPYEGFCIMRAKEVKDALSWMRYTSRLYDAQLC